MSVESEKKTEQEGEKMSGIETVVVAGGELLRQTGDTPDGKKAIANLGQALSTVTQTLNVLLLPLAAINFAYERAKTYFNQDFKEDVSEKTKDIPKEELIEPKASLAGQIIQGLAFAHEETELKEMYLNLLRTSMDNRVANHAHPAFAEIIRQLTTREATILQNVLNNLDMPIVEVWALETEDAEEKRIWIKNILDIQENGIPSIIPDLAMMVDNWVRLGLITIDMRSDMKDEGIYDWADHRIEVIQAKVAIKRSGFIPKVARGTCDITDFGVAFAKAVGISENDPAA